MKWHLIAILICIFLIILWASFRMFVRHLYMFFAEMFIQDLCPVFNILLSCKSFLYYSVTRPLTVLFANCLSHSMSCIFTLWIISFDEQKLNFEEFQIIDFSFCCYVFNVGKKNLIFKSFVIPYKL